MGKYKTGKYPFDPNIETADKSFEAFIESMMESEEGVVSVDSFGDIFDVTDILTLYNIWEAGGRNYLKMSDDPDLRAHFERGRFKLEGDGSEYAKGPGFQRLKENVKHIGNFIGDYTDWALGTADPDTTVMLDPMTDRLGALHHFLAEQGHAFQFLGTPMEDLKLDRRLGEEREAYGDSRALTDSLTGEEIGFTRGTYGVPGTREHHAHDVIEEALWDIWRTRDFSKLEDLKNLDPFPEVDQSSEEALNARRLMGTELE
tara:strand:+ start:2830 stop:3606 length:777 start_codon:yes stop_codon:yes gene_type:complete